MVEGRRKQREVSPRKYASENKRPTISFRVRADMLDKLKASAEEHDLSLSEEVERCVNFKFSFARDAHDEVVMQSIRTAFYMAEEVAGARWFESKEAALICNKAMSIACNLLVLGIGPGNQGDVASTVDDAGAAIAGEAINRIVGLGTEESKKKYEAAIAAFLETSQRRYLLIKALSEYEPPQPEAVPHDKLPEQAPSEDDSSAKDGTGSADPQAKEVAKPTKARKPRAMQLDLPEPREVPPKERRPRRMNP